MKRRTAFILLGALATTGLLGGCSTTSYYWQAFTGQMEVRRLSRPVDDVIAAADTSAELRARLEYARQARDFASKELGLPDNGSYRVYADLKRNYVVWNVFAAPALSLELKTQCFPIAGCVTYRGYFSEDDARAYADKLRAEGLDVYSGGVPAYSTLGYFNDPLLNTFIRYPELEIARLIFHELGHQVAYAKGDSTFNESFATTVEEEGLKRWMAGHATPEQKTRYEQFGRRRDELMAMMRHARDKLEAIYKAPGPEADKRAAKEAVFTDLRGKYEQMKLGWDGYKGYDAWIAKDLNNAKLGSISTYSKLVPAFNNLLAREHGDLPGFYARVKQLAAMPKEERDRELVALGAPANTAADN
ncbi:MAG TPA: aminopeptidase [Burkholderiales bacterium]|nr:aminopeptidase [Burkholderiales bacterium]